MPKAYTQKEREEIKARLIEEGLVLFHENGNKALSIRELTSKVGISQGSFYNFYATKEDLVMDIVDYRSSQKLDLVFNKVIEESRDPKGAIATAIYGYMADMAVKVKEKRMYRDMVNLALTPTAVKEGDKRFLKIFDRLNMEWKKRKIGLTADAEGLWNVISGSCLLIINQDNFNPKYFDEILKNFITSGVERYIHNPETKA